MKDCAFQYATKYKILVATDLITREEAEKLWEENVDDFKRRMEKGENPEMALWIDMAYPENYRTTAKNWIADDLMLENGKLYEKVLLG